MGPSHVWGPGLSVEATPSRLGNNQSAGPGPASPASHWSLDVCAELADTPRPQSRSLHFGEAPLFLSGCPLCPPLSSVQDVSERAAWGVLVCEPQHREADPGSPHHPGGPRVSSLLQRAAGGSRGAHPADAVNRSQPVPGTPTPTPLQSGQSMEGACVMGGGGASRSSDMCIYIWKEPGTSSAHPAPPSPSPAGDACTLPDRGPAGQEGDGCSGGAGVNVWEREKKKFLFLNPCVSFA